MYIHLHMMCLTGATELGTVRCHFAPNQRRFQWSISRWILLRRNNIFGKKFKVELKFICAEFQIFSTLSKHDITILVIISHGNRSLTSYGLCQTFLKLKLKVQVCRPSCKHTTNHYVKLKVNSLWPSDAIWWHKPGSILAQILACCQTAPRHYLNQHGLQTVNTCDINMRALS